MWVSKIPFLKLQFLWFLSNKTAEKTNRINHHGNKPPCTMVLKLRQSLLITFLKCLTLISKTLKTVLKYGFCNKSFRKGETLTSWTLLQHICSHFWAWMLLYSAIKPKSVQLVRVSSFQNDLLQNPYFSTNFQKFQFLT